MLPCLPPTYSYLGCAVLQPGSCSAPVQTTVERVFAFLLRKKVPRQTEGEGRTCYARCACCDGGGRWGGGLGWRSCRVCRTRQASYACASLHRAPPSPALAPTQVLSSRCTCNCPSQSSADPRLTSCLHSLPPQACCCPPSSPPTTSPSAKWSRTSTTLPPNLRVRDWLVGLDLDACARFAGWAERCLPLRVRRSRSWGDCCGHIACGWLNSLAGLQVHPMPLLLQLQLAGLCATCPARRATVSACRAGAAARRFRVLALQPHTGLRPQGGAATRDILCTFAVDFPACLACCAKGC